MKASLLKRLDALEAAARHRARRASIRPLILINHLCNTASIGSRSVTVEEALEAANRRSPAGEEPPLDDLAVRVIEVMGPEEREPSVCVIRKPSSTLDLDLDDKAGKTAEPPG